MLAAVTRPVIVWKGVALGTALWLIMQILWLPFVDRGFFGTAHTPMIAIATLVLHLIYGRWAGSSIGADPASRPTTGWRTDHAMRTWLRAADR